MVVDAPEVVRPFDSEGCAAAGGQRRECAVQGQDLEAVAGQLQVPDDLGPQEADDVGRDREPEARHDLLGHGSAAQDVAPLQDKNPAAGSRQVRGGNQAVVTAADHDCVVAVAHRVAG